MRLSPIKHARRLSAAVGGNGEGQLNDCAGSGTAAATATSTSATVPAELPYSGLKTISVRIMCLGASHRRSLEKTRFKILAKRQKKLAATSPAFSAAHTAHRCKRKQPQARFIAASHLLPKKCTYPINRCRTHFSRMHKAAALVVCALAATALTPPQRAVRRQTRLRARTAEGMAPGWKATTDETGAYELIPASYEYQYQEIFVEIPRTAESPGLGVLLEQFGTLDAEDGGLTLVAGLVEGGNAANAGVDLLPGD